MLFLSSQREIKIRERERERHRIFIVHLYNNWNLERIKSVESMRSIKVKEKKTEWTNNPARHQRYTHSHTYIHWNRFHDKVAKRMICIINGRNRVSEKREGEKKKESKAFVFYVRAFLYILFIWYFLFSWRKIWLNEWSK